MCKFHWYRDLACSVPRAKLKAWFKPSTFINCLMNSANFRILHHCDLCFGKTPCPSIPCLVYQIPHPDSICGWLMSVVMFFFFLALVNQARLGRHHKFLPLPSISSINADTNRIGIESRAVRPAHLSSAKKSLSISQ